MRRRKILAIQAGLAAGLVGAACAENENSRMNVLFITIDDLNTDLPSYGVHEVIAPEMERLATEGVIFLRHYVNNPICIPSRANLFTGVRSETSRQVFGPTVWNRIEGIEPIGRTFKNAGYQTISLGKVWHTQDGSNPDEFDVRWHPNWTGPYRGTNLYAAPEWADKDWNALAKLDPPAVEHEPVEDEAYPDGRMTAEAVRHLHALAQQDKPFLLMAGFQKPHLPFACPKKYYDLYEGIEISLPPNPDLPADMPTWAHNNFNDLQYYVPRPEMGRPLSEEQTRELRRSYYACISFIDAQIGKIMEALRETGLDQNTIVVLWSDHGFHLGDQGLWSKATNFERAVHAPLIVSLPPTMDTPRGPSNAFVETVDVFPTLLELCGIPMPPVMEGVSFVPVLKDLEIPWKKEVYHMFERYRNFLTGDPAPGGVLVGYAVRNDRYRYVEWVQGWNLDNPDRRVISRELYDYQRDPHETRNVAGDPEKRGVLRTMQQLLVDRPGKALSGH